MNRWQEDGILCTKIKEPQQGSQIVEQELDGSKTLTQSIVHTKEILRMKGESKFGDMKEIYGWKPKKGQELLSLRMHWPLLFLVLFFYVLTWLFHVRNS